MKKKITQITFCQGQMKSDLEKVEAMRRIIKLHYIPFATIRFFLTFIYINFLQLFCDLTTVFSEQRRNLVSRELFIQPRFFSQVSLHGLMIFMRSTQPNSWPMINCVMAIKQF